MKRYIEFSENLFGNDFAFSHRKLTINEFVRSSCFECCHLIAGGYLQKSRLYDSPRLIRRVCNSTAGFGPNNDTLPTIVSPGNVRIEFVSDYSVMYQGFILEYVAGEPSVCSSINVVPLLESFTVMAFSHARRRIRVRFPIRKDCPILICPWLQLYHKKYLHCTQKGTDPHP